MKKLVEDCKIDDMGYRNGTITKEAIIEYSDTENEEFDTDRSSARVHNVYFFVETSDGVFSKVRISTDTIKRLNSEIESLEKRKK